MHLAVTVNEKQVAFRASFVYAFNSYLDRVPLWCSLSSIATSAPNLPWIIRGDFNVVRFPSEKVGGNLSWPPTWRTSIDVVMIPKSRTSNILAIYKLGITTGIQDPSFPRNLIVSYLTHARLMYSLTLRRDFSPRGPQIIAPCWLARVCFST